MATKKSTRSLDLISHSWEWFTVVAAAPKLTFPNGGTARAWVCQCRCGNTRVIDHSQVLQGKRKSCGCRFRVEHKPKKAVNWHGHARLGRVTSEYRVYQAMLARCYRETSPDWPRYGGRGIEVCARWRESFQNFYADMGNRPPGMSLDRIDVDGHYAPENCRWATPREQAQNRRKNRPLTFNGETKCLTQWARDTGIPYSTLFNRLKFGWPLKRALVR
jgi:hypothetical protein